MQHDIAVAMGTTKVAEHARGEPAHRLALPSALALVSLQNRVIPEAGSTARLLRGHGYVFHQRPAPGTIRAYTGSGYTGASLG